MNVLKAPNYGLGIQTNMSSSLGKRTLPRRELPWVGKLLEKLSNAHLPTNMMILRRLLLHLEQNPGTSARETAKIVEIEIRQVYENGGYGDILHQQSNNIKMILKLHSSYKDLSKIPSSAAQSTPSSNWRQTVKLVLCNFSQQLFTCIQQAHP